MRNAFTGPQLLLVATAYTVAAIVWIWFGWQVWRWFVRALLS
jgi:hypothetical protein